MKKITLLILINLMLSFVFVQNEVQAKNEILPVSNNCWLQLKLSNDSIMDGKTETEQVGKLTLLVNGMNNIIATYGILLALITIVLGAYTLLSFSSFKKSVRKLVNDKISVINKKELDYDERIKQITKLEYDLGLQDKYIGRSVNYIYSALINIAEKDSDKELLAKIHYDIQTIKLFSKDKDERHATLQYFSESGKLDIVDSLNFIGDNDSVYENRILALEVIGMIKERDKISAVEIASPNVKIADNSTIKSIKKQRKT